MHYKYSDYIYMYVSIYIYTCICIYIYAYLPDVEIQYEHLPYVLIVLSQAFMMELLYFEEHALNHL